MDLNIKLDKVFTVDGMENKIINSMNKRKLQSLVDNNDINLEYILSKSSVLVQDKHKFNYFLRKISKKYNFKLYEIILFLENYFIKLKKILSLLDDENKILKDLEVF